MKKEVLVILALLILVIAGSRLIPFPAPVGRGDFVAYWSASYLLAHSQNASDPDLLLQVEQEKTGRDQDYVLMTWNPPWLLALLLPYTLFSFQQATWLWLLTNIALIFASVILVWRTTARTETIRRFYWIALPVAFAFSPTLIALIMGQVNTLVLCGIATFLYLASKERYFTAGASLVLTLVKPHLVYITLPLVLLAAVVKKTYWHILAGLGAAAAGLLAVVFFLRPAFVVDYGRTVMGSRLVEWATPTLGGILAETLGWNWAKLMGVVVLPLVVAWWWRRRQQVEIETLVGISLVISVVTAPFGWGYDVVVLLVPIIQMIVWVLEGRFPRLQAGALVALLLLVDGLSFYQRAVKTNEVYYFWLPLAIALLYLWAQTRLNAYRRVQVGELTTS